MSSSSYAAYALMFIHARLIALTVALSPWFAVVAQAQSYERSLDNAQILFSGGEFRRAGKVLIRLVKDYPERREHYKLLGRVFFRQGNFKKARDAFDRMDPKQLTSEAAYAWGASYYSVGRWSKAAYGFRKVKRRDRYRNLSAYYLGVCYFRVNRIFAAKKTQQSKF